MKIQYRKSPFQKTQEKVILDFLRKHNNNRPISFSDYIDITFTNSILTLSICSKNDKNPILDNMQNDGAAFEGWAICIKSWMPNINKVVLKWEPYNVSKKNGHYNRFLYRVLKFKEMFNWFEIDENNFREILNFKTELTNLKNNFSNKSPERPKDLKETRVEYDLVNRFHNQEIMKNHFGLTRLNQHLPVGIKKDGNSFFTGGASAIDLWGTTNKEELFVIELKYVKDNEISKSKNIKVGIVSELLFYVNVMRDIFQNNIDKPEGKLKEEIALYKSNIQSIVGCFFANEYHPLLENDNVVKLLNKNNLNFFFEKHYYHFNKETNQLESIK